MRDQWMRQGEAFILVYSITSRASFEVAQKLRAELQRLRGMEEDPATLPAAAAQNSKKAAPPPRGYRPPSAVPVVLVGNKNDLVDDREVRKEEGEALAKQWRCEFFEVSALKSSPDAAFELAARAAYAEVTKSA